MLRIEFKALSEAGSPGECIFLADFGDIVRQKGILSYEGAEICRTAVR
jgi:hypothetical protein